MRAQGLRDPGGNSLTAARDELDVPGIWWDDVLSLGEQQRLQFCRLGGVLGAATIALLGMFVLM